MNGTVPPRAGEEVDPARLAPFLEAALGVVAGTALEIGQFPSGYSNLTYLVRAGDRALVLRRPPIGSTVRTAHDMGREARVLRALRPAYPLVPAVLATCDDLAVLGYPFYLMEFVPGVLLRARVPAGVAFDAATGRRVATALLENLARLHALDAGAAPLAALGRPQGYAERQIRGWAERSAAARTDPVPDLDHTFARLAARLPPDGDAAVVHNDYKHDNVVLDPADLGSIRAVLDWEMATVGDPILDLGTTLGYWVEAGDPEEVRGFRFGPTDGPGQPTRRELVALYAAASGRDVSNVAYAYAFGLCKIAVIAQQIYVRYAQGLTRDPRFAALPTAIRALAARARTALAREEV